jgi:ATP-binding cassette subfamily B (MDR/TAP) protein 1
MAIIGLGSFICSFIMFSTWMIAGERQANYYRKHYFKALLNQDIGWYDIIK